MDELGLKCPTCGYCLTGLPGNICPECGEAFDRELLRSDPEYFRPPGTPVYLARGVGVIPRTLQTLLVMLARPRSFALRLRIDEPLGPAVAVFLIATTANFWVLAGFSCWWGNGTWRILHGWEIAVVPIVGVGSLILATSTVFAACSVRGESQAQTFPRRLRFWCVVTMYTTIFTPFWLWFCAGTSSLSWRDYTTEWPFARLYFAFRAYPITAFLLWWTLVISVVLWYRSRPRWLAIVLMLAAFLFVRASVQVVDSSIPRLAR